MSNNTRLQPNKLSFPFHGDAHSGKGLEVATGIRWFKLPLPFALDHVNCWLLGEPGDAALIDTGVALPGIKTLWEEHLSDFPQHKGIPQLDTVLITHFHPDHAGLAGWFSEAGSRMLGSAVEMDLARTIWNVPDDEYGAFYENWYRHNGLPEEVVAAVRRYGNTYRKVVHAPPADDRWNLLAEGDELVLAGQRYRVLIGRGHAPDMVMLYRSDDKVLIAADQVLPAISPNVSVMPKLVEQNPLQQFLNTLAQLKELPEDTLVLPSHGEPFYGLHSRLEVLEMHHQERLETVLSVCQTPQSASDLFKTLFRRKLDAQQTSFALGESLAHLHFLEARRELVRSEEGGVVRFTQS